MRKRWLDAEESYLAITRSGRYSEYYELALYKLDVIEPEDGHVERFPGAADACDHRYHAVFRQHDEPHGYPG
jgi:hypothetical protein